MRTIGFVRPVAIGKGWRGIVAHHQVVEMPAANADALVAAHGAAVADLTPKDFGFAVSVPRRMTALRVEPCALCGGALRMTACLACGGAGKVLVVR